MNFNKKLKIFTIAMLIPLFGIVSLSFTNINKHSNKRHQARKALSFSNDVMDWYWFSVRVRIDKREDAFKFVGVTGGIRHGKQAQFEKDLWQGLAMRQIAVGPFEQKSEARNAKALYKTSKDKIKYYNDPNRPEVLNWFAITFVESPRLRIFVIRRAPGAVATGSIKMFVEGFFVQLPQKLLEIGPFYNYDQAELAKRLYRKNE